MDGTSPRGDVARHIMTLRVPFAAASGHVLYSNACGNRVDLDLVLTQLARLVKRLKLRHSGRPTEQDGGAPKNLRPPEVEQAYHYLADGRVEAAEDAFWRAFRVDKNSAQLACAAGVAFAKVGQLSSAIRFFKAATDSDPNLAEAHTGLGSALLAAGELRESEASLKQALVLSPNSLIGLYNLGLVLTSQNRLEDAAQALSRAINLSPHFAEAYNQLGLVFKAANKLDKAIDSFQSCIELNPRFVAAYCNLIQAFCANQQHDKAEDLVRRMLGDAEFEQSDALEKLGYVKHSMGKLVEARGIYERALALNSTSATLCDNYAMVLQDLGEVEQAITFHTRALELDPAFTAAKWHRAIANLKRHHFSEAWPEYELRLLDQQATQRAFPYPRWEGSDLTGKTLLIHAEQGLGDEIMFGSCIPDAIEHAGSCVIECNKKLESIYRRSFPGAHIHGGDQLTGLEWLSNIPRPDFVVSVASLPLFFRNSIEQFPKHRGYLRADATRIEYWRSKLDALGGGLKVGISWKGGTAKTRGAFRTVPLDLWLPILRLPRIHFVSLQYTDCRKELESLHKLHDIEVAQWIDAIENYDETAALVCAVDLVISVQTALVHLSGALGQRTWVMVPICAEWRYGNSGRNMPWYPTVEIYRQGSIDEWPTTIDKISVDLARLSSERSGTTIPIPHA